MEWRRGAGADGGGAVAMKLVRGMRVLVAFLFEEGCELLPARLVRRNPRGLWTATDKRGVFVADITLEDEGITWVRGWTKTTERARALQAAVALA
jgi:hypothetical protein